MAYFKYNFATTCLTLTKIAKYKIGNDLTKQTVETLLNEIFALYDQDTNEVATRQCANEQNITATLGNLSFKPKNLFIGIRSV